MDWLSIVALCVMPLLCGALWFATQDFGYPFGQLFVVAMTVWGFLFGWVAYETVKAR